MRALFNLVMRIVSSLLGLLMLALGSIWIMQGLNVGPRTILQGFMVGDPQWTLWGAILALLGLGQVVWSNTRQENGNS
ncbi:MAG: hypothetical protein H6917_17715 [Novosphingobium sp.]|nr:hypothetical protein [Novosphingobium sp.]MCP5404214.1 hypothetical protein [Novosphingobium sp.]